MTVGEREIILDDALANKGHLQVDCVWGEKDATVAATGPLPQLSL